MSVVVNPKDLTFQLATTWADGTPMPASAIGDVALKMGTASGNYTKSILDTALTPDAGGLVHVNPSTLGIVDSNVWFVAAFTDATQSAGGLQSGPSNEIAIQFVKTPSPPSNFTAV